MGKTGVRVSALGYGCMRYPKKRGLIDADRAVRQMRMAIDGGVNYFDTAFVYNAGQSESLLGRAIADSGNRDSLFIADKVPPYLFSSPKDAEAMLGTMLRRLASDRVDFFLIHALNDYAGWERLKRLGYLEFAEAACEAGKLRYLGFSWHGQLPEFKRVVDDYDWDFCQIQYNYLDESFQAGTEGLRYAAAKGMGVSIMEGLRGGALARAVPPEALARMRETDPDRSAAAWALDWLWDHSEVSVVLSGLNDEANISENLALASASSPAMLSEAERGLFSELRELFLANMAVGCTGCSYCMPCPFGVDIPLAFSMLNASRLYKDWQTPLQYTSFTSGLTGSLPSGASLCRECGACEKKCPQHLEIRAMLKVAKKELAFPLLTPVVGALRLLHLLRGEKAYGAEKPKS
jgi:Predicted oxidoreductases of the aldo/keto reductase family